MELKSDNKFLEYAFNWAVNKTAQFVVTGTKNGDYPEISFTFISQTIEGIAGVKVDAKDRLIITCPRFPSQIKQICISDIFFGNFIVDLFISDDICIMENKATEPLFWQCAFKGEYDYLYINCKRIKVQHSIENGIRLSYAAAEIPCGKKAEIKKTL